MLEKPPTGFVSVSVASSVEGGKRQNGDENSLNDGRIFMKC